MTNYRIIARFSNSLVPYISLLFYHFEITKDVGDFLQQCYLSSDFPQCYHIFQDIFCMHQDSSQSINGFYLKLSYLWDLLAISKLQWTYIKDATIFLEYHNHM